MTIPSAIQVGDLSGYENILVSLAEEAGCVLEYGIADNRGYILKRPAIGDDRKRGNYWKIDNPDTWWCFCKIDGDIILLSGVGRKMKIDLRDPKSINKFIEAAHDHDFMHYSLQDFDLALM